MIGEVFFVGILGGLLHLDRTAACQFLVSRPIVTSFITGAILGNPELGLKIGVVLELLWLGIQPLGTALPPDDTVVAVAVPAGVIISGYDPGTSVQALWALGILIALPLSEVGRLLDVGVRRFNGRFLDAAKRWANVGNIKATERQHIMGLASFLIVFTVFSFLGVLFTTLTIRWAFPMIPEKVHTPLNLIFWTIPFFGITASITKREVLPFSIAFSISYIVLFFLERGF